MKIILFGKKKLNKSLQCFKVGLLGCISIDSVYHGKNNENIDMYSYQVNFDNGKSIEITNPVYVE